MQFKDLKIYIRHNQSIQIISKITQFLKTFPIEIFKNRVYIRYSPNYSQQQVQKLCI
jgi:hypothetical protein